MASKVCPSCKQLLDAALFGNSARSSDGLQCWCKQCRNRSAKESAKRNPDKARSKWRAAAIRWVRNNPEKKASSDKAYAEQNREKIRVRKQAWVEDNREAVRRTIAAWVAKNHEKVRKRKNAYAAANRGKIGHKVAAYRRLNAHKVNAWGANRRAVKAKCAWGDDLTALVVESAYELARRRSIASGIEWHVDHIVPLVSPLVCGLHSWTNLQVIPAVENMRKSNRWWPNMPEAI